jgi:hypothetical protein
MCAIGYGVPRALIEFLADTCRPDFPQLFRRSEAAVLGNVSCGLAMWICLIPPSLFSKLPISTTLSAGNARVEIIAARHVWERQSAASVLAGPEPSALCSSWLRKGRSDLRSTERCLP